METYREKKKSFVWNIGIGSMKSKIFYVDKSSSVFFIWKSEIKPKIKFNQYKGKNKHWSLSLPYRPALFHYISFFSLLFIWAVFCEKKWQRRLIHILHIIHTEELKRSSLKYNTWKHLPLVKRFHISVLTTAYFVINVTCKVDDDYLFYMQQIHFVKFPKMYSYKFSSTALYI